MIYYYAYDRIMKAVKVAPSCKTYAGAFKLLVDRLKCYKESSGKEDI
jgi:hypothetical protein